MKKLLLVALAILTFVGISNAQIFTENFDSGIPETWTMTDVDGNTVVAQLANLGFGETAWIGYAMPDANGLNKTAALSTSAFTTPGYADDWLVTPAIELPVITDGEIHLEFNAMQYGGVPVGDGLEIYVSTTGTAPADFIDPAIYNTTADGENPVWTLRTGIDLTSYNGQTVYIAFRNNSYDGWILAIDDVGIRNVLPIDGAIIENTTTKWDVAGSVTISGVIQNLGSTDITSFDLKYRSNLGDPVTENIVTTITFGSTYNYSHNIALSTLPGTLYELETWVEVVGDGNLSNDTITHSHTAVSVIPDKVVVGEERTGTWCGWCPGGAVALAEMESTSSFIGIAVHGYDPMTVEAYDGPLVDFVPNLFPMFGVDRVAVGSPSQLASMHVQRTSAIVPASVHTLDPVFNNATNEIDVYAEVEFFGDVSADLRLSCIIVQNDMVFGSSSWHQVNYYSGGNYPMAFPPGINNGYDFQAGPDPVPSVEFLGYDHTARALSNNDILGDVGSLPSPIINAGLHNYQFATISGLTMPGAAAVPFDYTKAHAIVMIIDASTGEILNARQESITLFTGIDAFADDVYDVAVYPNPTANVAHIRFALENSASVKMVVFNALGKMVYNEDAGIMSAGKQILTFDGTGLNNGFYFVNLTIGEQIISRKISLLK